MEPPYPPRNARAPFSVSDDALLIKYLAKYNPGRAGRTGNAIYKKLVENADNKWSWSANHPWQSWRNKYVKSQDIFDARIREYQLKHGINATDTPKKSSVASKRKEGLNDVLQSPRKRRRMLIESSDTESSPNDAGDNDMRPRTALKAAPGALSEIGKAQNFRKSSTAVQSVSLEDKADSVPKSGLAVSATLADRIPLSAEVYPVDTENTDQEKRSALPISESNQNHEVQDSQFTLSETIEDGPQGTSTPRAHQHSIFNKPEINTIIKEEANISRLPSSSSPTRPHPHHKASNALIDALTQLKTAKGSNTASMRSLTHPSPAKASSALANALSELRQSRESSITVSENISTQDSSGQTTPAKPAAKQAAARLASFVKQMTTNQPGETSGAMQDGSKAIPSAKVYIGSGGAGVTHRVHPAMVEVAKDNQANSEAATTSLPVEVIRRETSKAGSVSGGVRGTGALTDEALGLKKPTNGIAPHRARKLTQLMAKAKTSAAYGVQNSDTESDNSFHLSDPFIDDQSSTNSIGEQKLQALIAKKRGLLHYSNDALRSGFVDKGKKRHNRIPDLDSSDDEQTLENLHEAQMKAASDWPPTRRKRIWDMGPAKAVPKSKATSAKPVNEVAAKPPAPLKVGPSRRQEVSKGSPAPVAGPSRSVKESKQQDKPQQPHVFVDDVAAAAMQDWRARVQPSNEHVASSPEIPSFLGDTSEPFVHPEHHLRGSVKGKEKALPERSDRRQTFGGFSRTSLPPIPRVDLRLKGKQSMGLLRDSYIRRGTRLWENSAAESLVSGHSRRGSLASTIDLAAEYVPLTYGMSESDQCLASNAGLQVLFAGMAENHGFSEDIVRRVWEEVLDIPATDAILREMREAAEQVVLDKLTKRTSTSRIKHVFSAEDVRPERERLGMRLPRYSGASLNAIPLTETDMVLNGREKYSPPPVSRAAQFVRLVTQGRAEEAVRREVRRSRGMHVPTPVKETGARRVSGGEPLQQPNFRNNGPVTIPVERMNDVRPTWTADEDAILLTGDDGALEALELRMGKGSVKRRIAELIASNRLP